MSRDIRNTVASTKVLWIKGNATTGKRYYLPSHHEYCWSVIPPAPADELEAWRIFPGGDVAVLAESWVRTYEMIEQTIEGFDSPVLVKLRDFVADPLGTLAEIYETINLPVPRHPLPELDTSRGDGWREILTSQEQRQLEAFIENNRSRIERLKYADTTL